MMLPSSPVQVYLAAGVTDMRKAINGLSILVEEQLDLDPLSGHLFCFCNRKRDIVKILYWDRNGYCLWVKRLEEHRFQWPETAEESITIESHKLAWLLDGLSLHQTDAHERLCYEKMT